MCARFNLLKEDTKVFGDKDVMKMDPNSIPARILGGYSSGTTESNSGAQIVQMNAGFTVQASTFNDPTSSETAKVAFLSKIVFITFSLILNAMF